MKKLLALVITIFLSVTLFNGCKYNDDIYKNDNNFSENNQSANDGNADLQVDISNLKSYDGQLLIYPTKIKEIPERPTNPELLPLADPMHWYDIRFPGWVQDKINIPSSPGDGAKGKKIYVIVTSEHPYWTAVGIGAKKVADAYGIDFRMLNPNGDLLKQNQLIDDAINDGADMIILAAIDKKEAVSQAIRINEKGIPLIFFNTLPESQALKYCLAWTGPDDWGNFRMLARVMADELDKEGGVCYLRHTPVGGSPYYARNWGPITEFREYAPDIKSLDSKDCDFDYDMSKEIVKNWIDEYGDEIKGIVCSDDSIQAIGAIDACKETGRSDIVIVASGNGKNGMDAVKKGDLFAITYQSAEADGALPIKVAADWFNGKKINDIYYLSSNIITEENVDKYMPAQW
ncbi:sugar ABC transporter substrate-binding protein [Vallitalea guaymasensis]|uniref:Sugar ABC transporter substrate-binding protein n=1 Tax=Vallitalea guaymasensis TaxID=1185412 RepID=A0A8J8SDH4_9FIRM|nr:sugar ABC transporter substrate-binding protein [Vallitalea guaymasensis]QUH30878.1 sugar ABC transporter substrate-binding protein [Vallitalea guaymasensis]